MALQQRTLPDIAVAWMQFVTTGELKTDTVRPEIRESWQRCRQAGVNAYDGASHHILPPRELQKLLKKYRELINITRPFMLNLYQFFKGSGYIVLLCDKQGYILEVFGDEETMENAVELNFIQGADWSETAVGTNAIGTALVLRKPLQVSGPEHYCRKHHAWTCSAAPLLDAAGNVLGVLDLSGPYNEVHSHTMGMVVAAQDAIRDQLIIHEKNRALTLANNQLTKIIQTMSDGIVVFDACGRITKLNSAIEKITGKSSGELLDKDIRDICGAGMACLPGIMSKRLPVHDVEGRLASPAGVVRCLVSVEPITDNGGVFAGGLLLVRPIERVRKLVNRFSGAQASFHFKDIIGQSQALQETIRLASLAADSQSTVLLQGESGTGKELFAQAIHNRSARRHGPFVAVNCGAIPRELLASELFGYEEGAFTGAKRGGRPGKFELASGGTLFLDEIGDMPLEQQVALLRVLQEKKVSRLGGNTPIPVDIRVICATNKDLAREVEKGSFRRDLYYRINVITITIPPLRQRREDIPVLFEHFLARLGRESGTVIDEIDPVVRECLQNYDWPGNVRELQNVVERMVSTAEQRRLTTAQLPPELKLSTSEAPAGSVAAAMTVDDFREQKKKQLATWERQQITQLLAKYGGNVSRVARELDISRNTLYRKIKRYHLEITKEG